MPASTPRRDDPTAGLRSIRIERRGGLAGLKPAADLEATALDAEQHRALVSVLVAPPPAATPPPTRGVPASADRYSYRITTTRADGATAVCTVDEARMPEALSRLCRPAGS